MSKAELNPISDEVFFAAMGVAGLDPENPNPEIAAQLDARLMRIYRRQLLLYYVMVVTAVCVTTYAFWSGWLQDYLLVAVLTYGYGLVAIVADPLTFVTMKKIPLKKATDAQLGPRIDRNELQEIVGEAMQTLPADMSFRQGREVPAIFIVDSKQANAMATNEHFFNSSRSLNAIYIYTALLHLLQRDEVRSIMAHEMGHFYRYINPYQKHRLAAHFFRGSAAFLMVVGIHQMGLFGGWGWIGGLLVAPMLAAAVVGLCFSAGHHEAEFLCDYAAARKFGVLPIVNALLKIAVRNDLYFVMYEETIEVLRSNPDLKVNEIVVAAEECLPHGFIKADEARRLIRTSLDEFRGAKSLTDEEVKAQEAVVKPIQNILDKRAKNELVHWRDFDSRIVDGQLDAHELRDFIGVLLGNKYLQVVGELSDADDVLASHPSFRRRILFLASTLPIET
ncbi:MAG: Zn-dependent protease with chaperone function [Pirellulaceae bacterium]|jgi:Zn-dependent protease with chaperone function